MGKSTIIANNLKLSGDKCTLLYDDDNGNKGEVLNTGVPRIVRLTLEFAIHSDSILWQLLRHWNTVHHPNSRS